MIKKTVSLRDTAISLHTPAPTLVSWGYCGPSQIPSPKSWPNFHFGVGGGTLDTTFLKYLSGGTQGILHQKFSQPSLLLHRK